MAPKGTSAPRYDQQFKVTVLEALQQHLQGADSANAAISATAAQFANHVGGGPSPSTVRNWGEAARVVEAPAKRTKSVDKPKRKYRNAVRADSPVTTPGLRDVENVTAAPMPTEALAAEPIDIDAVRSEATAPLLETLAEKDVEIERLSDLVSRSDIDLIGRIKELEQELALLRPLVELYLHKQRPSN
ncbi:hypothetical protein [Nocardia salmonicida]|uniref:hypothetical protein n=1 Tax=Nocardia salmonicida TaxID=53431 RepID=UPI0007A47054|nr:hypothetical protein [Nocardia salmonicida]MBC7299467.1 hypothetical protein [Nocardia sp.]